MIPPPLCRADGFPGQRMVITPLPVRSRAAKHGIARWIFPTHLGRFDHARHHRVDRPQGSTEYIFFLCLGGSGAVWLGKRRHPLSIGDAVILPPSRRHRYASDPDSPWSLLWFHFTGEGAAAFAAALRGEDGGPVFRLRDPDPIVEAFEDVYRYVLGGFTDADLLALSTGLSRFLGLCHVHRQGRTSRRRDAEARILKTIRYMHDHLDEPLSLADLAASAGWAPSHFSATFRHQTNTSPLVFLTRLRMQHACEALRDTDLPIGTISAKVGFPDPFYFSRLFRRQIGLAPSAYRAAVLAQLPGAAKPPAPRRNTAQHETSHPNAPERPLGGA